MCFLQKCRGQEVLTSSWSTGVLYLTKIQNNKVWVGALGHLFENYFLGQPSQPVFLQIRLISQCVWIL